MVNTEFLSTVHNTGGGGFNWETAIITVFHMKHLFFHYLYQLQLTVSLVRKAVFIYSLAFLVSLKIMSFANSILREVVRLISEFVHQIIALLRIQTQC